MSYLSQYNYLIKNGIPFELYIYPDGMYCFHIYTSPSSTLYIGEKFNSIDYYQFRCFSKLDVTIRSRLLQTYPGNIIYTDYK